MSRKSRKLTVSSHYIQTTILDNSSTQAFAKRIGYSLPCVYTALQDRRMSLNMIMSICMHYPEIEILKLVSNTKENRYFREHFCAIH